MRILTRYVVLELLQVYLLALTALTALMLIVGVAQEFMSEGLGPGPLLRMLPFLLPNALLFAVPGTVLFAVSMVYGRMSGANEIVAIKSLGINPMTVLWPAYVSAVVLSLLTVWLNDVAVSWGKSGVTRVALESIEEIAYSMLTAQKAYTSKQFSINVRRVEGKKLVQCVITFQGPPQITIRCAEAELRADTKNNMLKIICKNGTMDTEGGISFHFPDTIEREVLLADASRRVDRSKLPAYLPLRELPEALEDQWKVIEGVKQELASVAAYQLLTGDFRALSGASSGLDTPELKAQWNVLHRLQTETPRRWANGFSCLCFAWVGASMAIRLRNSDFLTSFFLCFMPILLVYYPMLMVGVDWAKAGAIPPQSVWIANLCLGLWGAWLLRKVIRL
jgi:lipopolysaccharide export system permease protein